MKMKTLHLYAASIAAATFLALPQAAVAFGNDPNYAGEDGTAMAEHAAPLEKSYHGHVVAVDASNRTISVKGSFFTRNFHVAANCKVYIGDKLIPSMADLRPGQKVEIRYEDERGARVATDIVTQCVNGVNRNNT